MSAKLIENTYCYISIRTNIFGYLQKLSICISTKSLQTGVMIDSKDVACGIFLLVALLAKFALIVKHFLVQNDMISPILLFILTNLKNSSILCSNHNNKITKNNVNNYYNNHNYYSCCCHYYCYYLVLLWLYGIKW